MNKRRREILAAFTPAVEMAMARSQGAGERSHRGHDVPGLALHARPHAEAPAELLIYGRIGGGSWFEDGIGAADVAALLKDAGPGPVNVRINSGGGDAFDGVAIHTLLSRHPGTVTTYVDGLAASAASVIAMAGDRVVCARNAMIMIHDAMTGPYGNAATLRRTADLLDQLSQNIADLYAERAGEDAEFWRAKMTVNAEDGSWFTGTEALDAGLVDELTVVKDDDEDEVFSRLSAWVGDLPEAVRAEVLPKIKAVDPIDEETDITVVADNAPVIKISQELVDDTQIDFAHSMSMWAFTNGLSARKEMV